MSYCRYAPSLFWLGFCDWLKEKRQGSIQEETDKVMEATHGFKKPAVALIIIVAALLLATKGLNYADQHDVFVGTDTGLLATGTTLLAVIAVPLFFLSILYKYAKRIVKFYISMCERGRNIRARAATTA